MAAWFLVDDLQFGSSGSRRRRGEHQRVAFDGGDDVFPGGGVRPRGENGRPGRAAVLDARGAILGMTRYVNKGHIARAALEATAYQMREVLDAMETDSGVRLTALKVDGGMVFNELLMQFQADILDVPVIRPKVAETTALGAAYAAGLAVGFWKDYDELRANWGKEKEWQPAMDSELRKKLYSGWKKAVTRTFDWVE